MRQVGRTELLTLAAGFRRIQHVIISCDASYYGAPGDPENGEPEQVAIKKL